MPVGVRHSVGVDLTFPASKSLARFLFEKIMVKRYKKSDDTSYALGATLTMELLLKKSQFARHIYVSPKSDVDEAVLLAKKLGVPVTESEKAFNILSPKENCFVIGEFAKFVSHAGDRHHIVLVNPSNCGNLGTIMREAAAFDCADLVIIRPAADPFDPKTVRASMGAVFDINFELFDTFEQYAERFVGREIMPFMLDGTPFSQTAFDKTKKYSLVFGNEATGLDSGFSRYGGVKIEQSPNVDSLNLSVAAAIALYKLYIS